MHKGRGYRQAPQRGLSPDMFPFGQAPTVFRPQGNFQYVTGTIIVDDQFSNAAVVDVSQLKITWDGDATWSGLPFHFRMVQTVAPASPWTVFDFTVFDDLGNQMVIEYHRTWLQTAWGSPFFDAGTVIAVASFGTITPPAAFNFIPRTYHEE